MSTERDVTRIVRSWLEEGRTALPDRVLDTVLDQLPATPQRRAPWPVRRLLDMNLPVRFAAAAAAVVLIVVVGALALNSGSGGAAALPTRAPTSAPTPVPTVDPSVVATPAPSVVAGPVPIPSEGVLAAGTYVLTPFVGNDNANACWTPPQPGCSETPADDSIRVTLTVPSGWEVDPIHLGVWLTGKNNRPPDGANLFVERGGWLYHDPCHSSASTAIKVGPSVDDFANAIAHDRSLDATAPTAVTLAGYSGKYLDLQIPSDISGCTDGYWPWEPGFFAQGPSQRWHVWILNVNGIRVVILTTDYAGTSAADRAATQAMVNSIRIQP